MWRVSSRFSAVLNVVKVISNIHEHSDHFFGFGIMFWIHVMASPDYVWNMSCVEMLGRS